jgi:D-glycero-D-manno-heptose 1,7-bisphosphate phosphatase
MPARELKILVLGRDGTLNAESDDYLHGPEDWQPLPGALDALARLHQAGWRLVIATNQSGLGRGLFDMATLNAVHARMLKTVAQAGARIDAIFFCPHAPDEGCDCRKPAPGLLREIARRYGVPTAQLVLVGDALDDVLAGVAAGCETHLVRTGASQQDLPATLPPGVSVHADLPAFADALLRRQRAAGDTT